MTKDKNDITQSELLAWADGLAGVSDAETAKKFGVNRSTIHRWRQKIKAFIALEFDVNQYRMPLYNLYPLILKSLVHNLKAFDVATTNNLLKGLQISVDKTINENPGDISNLSNDELTERLRERLGTKSKG
jgi:hypothetical protein